MKYFVTTFNGAEEIVEKEIKGVKHKGFLITEKKPSENLKSIIRTGIYLKHFKFKDLKDYKKQIKDIKFPIQEPFAVYCERFGNHKFSSKDIEVETASFIKGKVNLTDPKTIIYVLIRNNSCLIGIDLYKRRLDKRDYRIKPHPNALNSSLAFITLKFSNYNKNKSLLDPFCGSGVIPIEAALLGAKKVYASDNQYYCVEGTNVNSKVAKVKITTSKTLVQDLDKKFKKDSFDFIVTDPPIATIYGLKAVLPLYKLFIERANHLLKKQGTLTIITTRPDPFLDPIKYFKLKKELVIDKNNQRYHILVFK
ncbi:MAG: methyltransferase, partial [Nanoarchaeota archaeon]|nr:methyltransferase [Nanoarchaeota archaeon]